MNDNSFRPLIVCGVARSGTRMVTDLLNTHPSIVVQEEMHAKTIEAYFDFIDKVDSVFDSYSERKGRRLDGHWNSSKHILTHAFFMCGNKKEKLPAGESVVYHGIKTPGYERYFDNFEYVFSECPPLYIYCIRNPSKVWRSWKSLGFLSDFDIFYSRYVRSLRQAVKIKRNAPDRFICFDLESFISSGDKDAFFQENVVDQMLVKPHDLVYSSVENRNSIQKRGEKYVEDPSLKKEMDFLEEDAEILRLRKIIFS